MLEDARDERICISCQELNPARAKGCWYCNEKRRPIDASEKNDEDIFFDKTDKELLLHYDNEGLGGGDLEEPMDVGEWEGEGDFGEEYDIGIEGDKPGVENAQDVTDRERRQECERRLKLLEDNGMEDEAAKYREKLKKLPIINRFIAVQDRKDLNSRILVKLQRDEKIVKALESKIEEMKKAAASLEKNWKERKRREEERHVAEMKRKDEQSDDAIKRIQRGMDEAAQKIREVKEQSAKVIAELDTALKKAEEISGVEEKVEEGTNYRNRERRRRKRWRWMHQ